MWTREQYIQGVLIALAFFVLWFYDVPHPFSWYDGDLTQYTFLFIHFWETLGLMMVFLIVWDLGLRLVNRSPKSRERTKD